MVELLAPAGSIEALYAAVENKANAVYLAGNHFGARAYAKNFDNENLENAIKYAHLNNVAVHVTVNTIVDDGEMESLAKYLKFLEEIGADAILVQDLGVFKLAREIVPNLPLHASTQMTVHNLDGVIALKELGFSRVVMSRELTLEEIRNITKNVDIEIEVFMHGALCVCYSGMCLMSSMIGGRSGNRGRCAQPCRLPYNLVDEKNNDVLKGKAGNYLLSPKDLCTIEMLPELINAGVSSFKIEGRMKRPEYVATVVRIYRAAIDRAYNGEFYVSDDEKRDLKQIFNRGFTTAYLNGTYPGKSFISDKRPNNRGLLIGRVLKYENNFVSLKLSGNLNKNDIVEFWVKIGGRVAVTVDKLLNSEGKEIEEGKEGEIVKFQIPSKVNINDRAFKVLDSRLSELAKTSFENEGSIKVNAFVAAKIGEPLKIKFIDDLGNSGESETDFICEAARNRPLNDETLFKQLSRLGETNFALATLTTDMDENVMAPISEINEGRRRAIAELETARIKHFGKPIRNAQDVQVISLTKSDNKVYKDTDVKLIVRSDSFEKAKVAIESEADAIIFGSETYNHRTILADEYKKVADFTRKNGKQIFFSAPRIVKLGEDFKLYNELSPDGVYLHGIGQIYRAKLETDLPIFTDFSLIAYNAKTLEFLKDYGVSGVTLSEELTLAQIKSLIKKSPLILETIVHGKGELMVSSYCVLGSFLGEREGNKKCSMPCLKEKYFLKDRMNEKFPIVTDEYCRMHILNAKTRSMLPIMQELASLSIRLRIEGRYNSPKELAKIVSAYKKAMTLHEDAARELEEKLCNPKEITRGHFFRGVI